MSRKYRVKKHATIILVLLTAGVIILGVLLYKRHDVTRSLERATLPEAQNYEEAKENKALATSEPAGEPAPAATTKPTTVKGEINLAVPFTVQAPHAIWDPPYKEFCEEASSLMAASYVKGESIPNADFADAKLLEIKAFEEKEFGFYEDTTAAQTAVILQKHFGIKNVQVLDNPTADDFRAALDDGKLVLMPAAGRELGNPYFTAPGPLYHMLVIKGYTASGKFITNDPGTRRGADYVYSEDVLFSAMHDWHGDGNIDLGKKVVLIVG